MMPAVEEKKVATAILVGYRLQAGKALPAKPYDVLVVSATDVHPVMTAGAVGPKGCGGILYSATSDGVTEFAPCHRKPPADKCTHTTRGVVIPLCATCCGDEHQSQLDAKLAAYNCAQHKRKMRSPEEMKAMSSVGDQKAGDAGARAPGSDVVGVHAAELKAQMAVFEQHMKNLMCSFEDRFRHVLDTRPVQPVQSDLSNPPLAAAEIDGLGKLFNSVPSFPSQHNNANSASSLVAAAGTSNEVKAISFPSRPLNGAFDMTSLKQSLDASKAVAVKSSPVSALMEELGLRSSKAPAAPNRALLTRLFVVVMAGCDNVPSQFAMMCGVINPTQRQIITAQVEALYAVFNSTASDAALLIAARPVFERYYTFVHKEPALIEWLYRTHSDVPREVVDSIAVAMKQSNILGDATTRRQAVPSGADESSGQGAYVSGVFPVRSSSFGSRVRGKNPNWLNGQQQQQQQPLIAGIPNSSGSVSASAQHHSKSGAVGSTPGNGTSPVKSG